MTPARLREAGVVLYGKWGWQTRLATDLNVDSSTVRRWLSGAVQIPGPAAAAIECFVARYNEGRLLLDKLR
jgi:DNA-binding transcriptional regulator YdaS (Cro superfamily)